MEERNLVGVRLDNSLLGQGRVEISKGRVTLILQSVEGIFADLRWM